MPVFEFLSKLNSLILLRSPISHSSYRVLLKIKCGWICYSKLRPKIIFLFCLLFIRNSFDKSTKKVYRLYKKKNNFLIILGMTFLPSFLKAFLRDFMENLWKKHKWIFLKCCQLFRQISDKMLPMLKSAKCIISQISIETLITMLEFSFQLNNISSNICQCTPVLPLLE